MLALFLFLFVGVVTSIPCTQIQSPVAFVIPTFNELAPFGNSNSLNGQAIWVFELIGTSAYTRNNITFNVCSILPRSNDLLQYISNIQLTISTNQTLNYQYGATVPFEQQLYFNTSLVNNCTSGSLGIPHDIPVTTITDYIALNLLDDRGSSIASYYINGIEEMNTTNVILSYPPELPTLLVA